MGIELAQVIGRRTTVITQDTGESLPVSTPVHSSAAGDAVSFLNTMNTE